jgi:hypothetical protein
MSANDYYSAGKPQEQGGYYPPQGTFIHFPNSRAAPPSPHRILLDQASTCVITYIQDFLWRICYLTLAHLLLFL